MKFNKSSLGNSIFNLGLVGPLLKIFKRNLYQPFKNYKFSDEQLKFTHLLEAVNYCKVAQLPKVFLEFGCHSARTFSAVINAAQYLKISEMQFYAFDSFQGLPETVETVDGIFKKATFNTQKSDFVKKVWENTKFKVSEDYIIEGFFSDSLTLELQKTMPKVGMIHIDVDLYSSSVDVLKFIRPLLTVGTVILFDDYYCFPPDGKMGEMRAFLEMLQDDSNLEVKEWKAYSTFGQSFFITKCC